jgi:hypothetical protein
MDGQGRKNKEEPQNGRNMKEFRVEVNCKKNTKNFDISYENQAPTIPLFQPSHKKAVINSSRQP